MTGADEPKNFKWLVGALLLLTALLFYNVASHNFLDFDDNLYVTENEQVLKGLTVDGVIWAFTHSHSSNWHPLTWISHMVDVSLFGMNPAGHHLVNLALHCGNAL